MQTLHNIWSEIGFQEDQKEERIKSLVTNLHDICKQKVNEEEELKATLQADVETCRHELETLRLELGLPTYEPEEPMSILMLKNELRTKVDDLKLEKHERMKQLKSLRDTESMLCDRLCLPAHILGDVAVPTKAQLKELEANVNYLHTKEQLKRQTTFKELRQSIQILWRELETVPSTTIGQQLAQDNAETTFQLSSQNIQALRDLNLELVNQHKKCIAESSELRQTMKSLWTKLEVDESERKAFLSKHDGFKPSVITKLKNEVQRLQALSNIQKSLIDGLRKKLSDLWDKCYFGPAQREEFTPAFDDNFTEELLALHKHQVEVMENYYDGNKDLFKLVEKRETLFKKMEEYESRKNAHRLANPGRALLKEENINRKNINKELLKIEEKLKVQIGKWEEEHGQRFLINGCHYMSVINHQWEAFRNAQKEQEKLDWQKRQLELMEKEMTPVMTHVKRKRPFGGTTPLNTPKRRRIQDCTTSTPSMLPMHSDSICLSSRRSRSGTGNTKGCPPVATKSNIRRVGKTIKRKVTLQIPSNQRQSARLAMKRQVLTEKIAKQ